MCPCSPTDLVVNIPAGPTGPAIPGFGSPFATGFPNFNIPFPDGFPEDLLEILDLVQMILPSGILQGTLSVNFGKDVFDAILSVLEKFMPFLMLYKFFLPVLNLIVCIIEVLCAIPNPFKLPGAISRLFRVCLPEFLALFPMFAIIIMLISLLLLIIALVEYIIQQILLIIEILLANINIIVKALTKHDAPSILRATRKIGLLLCGFQNLFVLLSILAAIFQTIKDILQLGFSIPPCSDGNNGNDQKCCTPDVCPSFIKNDGTLTRDTGTFQYIPAVTQGIPLSGGFFSSLPPGFPASFFETSLVSESWQFYDAGALIPDAFWNITSAYDLPSGVTQVFFPTDATYTATTTPAQAPYTINITLYYNPLQWGRVDPLGSRYLQVNNCIVLAAPTQQLKNYDNSTTTITNGVLQIAGGTFYENDGVTPVLIDGVPATLNNFIHQPATIVTTPPSSLPNDGYLFSDVSYTFNINYPVLLQKSLITLGCLPSVSLDRDFVNSVFGGNAGANIGALNGLLNGGNDDEFPNPAAAQQCLTNALSVLRSNISAQGVADFQASTTVCLNQLSNAATSAINSLIGIGFDQYNSTVTLSPSTQFTTAPITVTVSLLETSGQNIITTLPASVASNIGLRITSNATFGSISGFSYDGYGLFSAQIVSPVAGSGTLQVAFDNQIISTATLPTDLSIPATTEPVTLPYTFVYSPFAAPGDLNDGTPIRDPGDVARDGETNGGG